MLTMLTALIIFLGLSTLFGLLLGYAAIKFKIEGNPVAESIDKILPQTQCGQCSFPGCKPYAEALAKDALNDTNETEVNLCIPGGQEVMILISEITLRQPKEMDAVPEEKLGKITAFIDEDICIGCTHCIKACPVDAIMGATKLMHTVIQQECTGCEKCIPVCPVDCIDMLPEKITQKNWSPPKPDDSPLTGGLK